MLSEVCIQCNNRRIIGDDFKVSLLQMLQSFLCVLCFAFCQSVAEPAQTTPEPQSGPHGDETAPCDSETPCIGEKGPHEAKGTMELRAHRPKGKRAYNSKGAHRENGF